ncbi:hypothetical protein TREES_T100009090 [Tupaia chinensis]|uniref:Uncharacterized protein n=1 Tax=Tupaia chinensis TaxID=246437 RepID=L9KSH0_TUPCH|nr:hypothetical protein TREES_T100009090 [Tupaia chinensis]
MAMASGMMVQQDSIGGFLKGFVGSFLIIQKIYLGLQGMKISPDHRPSEELTKVERSSKKKKHRKVKDNAAFFGQDPWFCQPDDALYSCSGGKKGEEQTALRQKWKYSPSMGEQPNLALRKMAVNSLQQILHQDYNQPRDELEIQPQSR